MTHSFWWHHFLTGTALSWASAVTGPVAPIASSPPSCVDVVSGPSPAGLPAGPVTGAAPKRLGEGATGAAHL